MQQYREQQQQARLTGYSPWAQQGRPLDHKNKRITVVLVAHICPVALPAAGAGTAVSRCAATETGAATEVLAEEQLNSESILAGRKEPMEHSFTVALARLPASRASDVLTTVTPAYGAAANLAAEAATVEGMQTHGLQEGQAQEKTESPPGLP